MGATGLQPAGLQAWQPNLIPGQTCHAIGCRGKDKAAFDEAMSNAEAWQKGNETYKKTFGNKGVLKSPPKKKVAVVACMDARFHLEKALALKEGDAHIIRNAGDSPARDPVMLAFGRVPAECGHMPARPLAWVFP